ncbi:NAD(+) synthase [Sutterella sp.]|uniref:NAD(+) synthase n=1 Tax=Sutterella sp. TaxID=1981025 RepID=UPI0026DF5030|nr:NAD(+) synthase [Sutterella sp.]MDO5531454.1 NAD(+) synthase [Sutterella sp.]
MRIGVNETGFVNISSACFQTHVGEPARNADEIVGMLEKAVAARTDLLILPELALTGYTCGDLFVRSALLSRVPEALDTVLKATAKTAPGMIVVLGAPVAAEGKLFNCALYIQDGRILACVPKSYLPNYHEYYEERWFSTESDRIRDMVEINGQTVPFGTDIIVESPSGLRVGAEICEDLWVGVSPHARLAAAGANVLVNLSASNETAGKSRKRRSLACVASGRTLGVYAYASSGPGESTTDLVFSGHLMIAVGSRIAAESMWKPGLITVTCDLEKIELERIRTRTESKGFAPSDLTNIRRVPAGPTPAVTGEPLWPATVESTPFVPKDDARRTERCKEILGMQAAGLVGRLTGTGIPRVVIGISGGLDSTLALLAICEAFDTLGRPRSDIIGISMPGFGTSARTKESARTLMTALGITQREIDIRPACRQHFADIGHPKDKYDVVFENVQARERTQILMDVANASQAIVIGTSDMSELALGWATFNGDHMSMYAVNAGVPKTLVKHLVSTMGLIHPELKDVLDVIVSTEISPELLPPDASGRIQSTESTIGSYVLHDFFLFHMMRFGYAKEKIVRLAKIAFPATDPAEIERTAATFFRRFYQQQYKRSSMPDGPKIGSVALSPRGDLRLPSDMRAIEG